MVDVAVERVQVRLNVLHKPTIVVALTPEDECHEYAPPPGLVQLSWVTHELWEVVDDVEEASGERLGQVRPRATIHQQNQLGRIVLPTGVVPFRRFTQRGDFHPMVTGELLFVIVFFTHHDRPGSRVLLESPVQTVLTEQVMR
ncbi:hypothetical protein D3C76_1478360 [compost metagenome]